MNRVHWQGSAMLLVKTRVEIQTNVYHFHSSHMGFLTFMALDQARDRVSVAWFS